ncbi:4-(cytidine 5'-diphospho)-2-C-methyl-D-erythritol kinase [Formicincola oecophyllae]|uniref:4-diphosphocytidyl-2-C-methyl-D-erythritol kinase n=1 Tax=Formicincola oecophyllae TaxID=2558361 RepID=A0A4Y6U9A1_9PROT|nr:4-(cytidine 5'-diphospho)-2-C-methyl-D-erythritol kinase [Formicincola oecophyllae]QDH14043.1 4-(cytidine 5'-diphospho)-2-C-methyl-D-erythritol kinase [Formicincola oecophyllae]
MPSPISTPQARSENAHAKINLYLHVTGRRGDGYHLLDSLVVFAGAHDTLTLGETTAGPTLALGGAFGPTLQAEAASQGKAQAVQENLVIRAARALAPKALGQQGGAAQLRALHLNLAKNLPVASGIGGGSADAAACLRLLARLWGADGARLATIAPTLGADVPVCLQQRAVRMAGIGEHLTPAPAMPPVGMVLANPGVPVSTPAIFKRLKEAAAPFTPPAPPYPSRGWATAGELASWLGQTGNDLQAPAEAEEPAITALLGALSALPGARLARMSGSGATCFALFDDVASAQAALPHLHQEALPGQRRPWQWAGGLFNA